MTPNETPGGLVQRAFSRMPGPPWLGGSIVRGNATATSDLDITVLLPGPPAPYRDSIMFGGWPVELFVHTERRSRTTARRIKIVASRRSCDWSASRSSCSTPTAPAPLQQECAAEVAAGPRPLLTGELACAGTGSPTCSPTSRASTDHGELAAISARCGRTRPAAAHRTGHWTGTGKGLRRELRRTTRRRRRRTEPTSSTGCAPSIAGDPGPLISVCDRVLDRFGGRHFDGHRLGGETTATMITRIRGRPRAPRRA